MNYCCIYVIKRTLKQETYPVGMNISAFPSLLMFLNDLINAPNYSLGCEN